MEGPQNQKINRKKIRQADSEKTAEFSSQKNEEKDSTQRFLRQELSEVEDVFFS